MLPSGLVNTLRQVVFGVQWRPCLLLLAALRLSVACYVFPAEVADPCRDVVCPHGGRCVPGGAEGGEAVCECPARCPIYGDHVASRPVCGSDGRDYRDQCHLTREACSTNTHITIKFHGKCDPCATITCSEPEVCQLDGDRKPTCKCGESCSLEFTPVCASDGKTYSNECALRQEACRARKTLRIIYRGKCSSGVNPCSSVKCHQGEECAINKFGIARCECPTSCEPVMRPVCGDDSKTYDSVCELSRASCAAKKTLRVAYTGACGGMSLCKSHVCEFGALCVELAGMATCECPVCPSEFAPICGSDGISYNNECKLRQESCQHKRKIEVLYEGLCNGCENRKCDHYAICESDGSGGSQCICPETCPIGDSPVCGTDGKTYKSDCDLRVNSCRNKQYVILAYKGDCDLCQGVECKFSARCEAGECVCPTNCSSDGTGEPVCGSNMVTYRGECELQKAKCEILNGSQLTVLFFGDCRERLGVPLTTATSPSLHHTGITLMPHNTQKHVESNIISSSSGSEACRDIHCDFEATCELGPDQLPRCTCHFNCNSATALSGSKVVCASDLKLYQSLCAMKMEGCMRQEELRLRPLDLCQGMEVKPCNGGTPLVDTISSREFDCGNGPNRQDCPSGSYCHQTPHFAKCCKKDASGSSGSCEGSWFGCCPDAKTPALGPENAGCPSMCGCNRLGSVSDRPCDPETQQCVCKPGVGGVKCDRCEAGYWGLPKISEGHQGCIPCGCSVWGSVRDDCEQMTGRCVCKPGIQGQKCTICTGHNKVLGPHGCVKADLTTPVATSCLALDCYFGAICEEHHGHAECVCRSSCADDPVNKQVVCGNDGQTYGSECQLKLYACRYQKDIVVQALGSCKEDMFPGTEWPLRRSTADRSTEPEDVSSSLYKSTRHLLIPSSNNKYYSYNSHLTLEPRHQVKSSIHHDVLAGYRPTPATIRVVQALLGDLCSEDSDCGVPHSQCVALACVCKDDYAETPDRQECIANSPPIRPTLDFRACASHPCQHEGLCQDGLHNSYTCVCAPSYTGQQCDLQIKQRAYTIPAFDGRSFVRLKHLKAYNKLSIEVEFKTYSNDGVIIYNQQKSDGTGDFVSLAVVNGFVEFRYNLGNGAVVIRSLDRVQMKKFHRVVAKRYHRDGMLKLDDSEDVAGQSQGSLKSLDLSEHAYVGYIPTNISRVFENAGTTSGLMGCIRKLKIGRHVVELHQGEDPLVDTVHGVRECGENPCSLLPCHNMGTCHAIDSHKYVCTCSLEYTGLNCETRVNSCVSNPCTFGSTCDTLPDGGFVCKCPPGRKGKLCQDLDAELHELHIPEFFGESYLEQPRLEGVGRAFSLEVWFLSRAPDGILLYNGQLINGKGDFISLNLVQGKVQFRFDLGSGIANLTTTEEIHLDQWHVVRVSRVNKNGTLQLDQGVVVKGSSGPPLNELNLELPLYIGGVPSLADVSRDAGLAIGLTGVVQRIIVNGQAWSSLFRATSWPAGVLRYNRHPTCQPTPCRNQGICQPMLAAFKCACPLEYTGGLCETRIDSVAMSLPVRFTGETFYQYANKVGNSINATWPLNTNITLELMDNEEYEEEEYQESKGDEDGDGEGDMYDEDDVEFFDIGRKGEKTNRYEMTFHTSESDGLMLWMNKGQTLRNDYISIAIVSGFVEFSFNLGKQQSFLAARSQVLVSDGAWHTLVAHRRKRQGYIAVDGESPVKLQADHGANILNTNARLFIGGAPTLPSGLPAPYYLGFRGCIEKVRLDRKPLNLLHRLGNDKSPVHFCHDNDI